MTNNNATTVSQPWAFSHSPEQPILLPAALKKVDAPPVLLQLIDKIEAFYWEPMILPRLNFALSKYQMKSSRREALVRFIKVLAKNTDLATMTIGKFNQGKFTPVKFSVLADEAEINKRRADRIVRALKKAGYLTVTRQYEKDKEQNTYKGFAAIKTIKEKLFKDLGILKRLKTDRNFASEKLGPQGREKINKSFKVTKAKRYLQSLPLDLTADILQAANIPKNLKNQLQQKALSLIHDNPKITPKTAFQSALIIVKGWYSYE